jgi:6-phospho-3-hexuloisomerase
MADDLKNPNGVLPMGSLYEAALFLFFEIVIITLRELLQESAESMRARHTNLE